VYNVYTYPYRYLLRKCMRVFAFLSYFLFFEGHFMSHKMSYIYLGYSVYIGMYIISISFSVSRSRVYLSTYLTPLVSYYTRCTGFTSLLSWSPRALTPHSSKYPCLPANIYPVLYLYNNIIPVVGSTLGCSW